MILENDLYYNILKNILVISLVLPPVLFKAKEWSLVFIYQILNSTDFSKIQLKNWHFLVFL